MRGRSYDFDPVVLTIQAGHFDEAVGYYTARRQGASSWLLIYTVSGEGKIGYPGGTYIASPGDACLLTPRIRHEYGTSSVGRWEILWAHFQTRPHWDSLLDWPAVGPGLAVVAMTDPAFERRLRDAVAHAALPETFDEMLAMNALEEVLLRGQRAAHSRAGRGLDERVKAAMVHASSRRGSGLDVEALASDAGLSMSRFVRLFRAQTGLTPRAYLEIQRINRAKELLAMTRMPIRAVAETVGFESEFYFSTRFRKLTGFSPRDYRRATPQQNVETP